MGRRAATAVRQIGMEPRPQPDTCNSDNRELNQALNLLLTLTLSNRNCVAAGWIPVAQHKFQSFTTASPIEKHISPNQTFTRPDIRSTKFNHGNHPALTPKISHDIPYHPVR
jgi:hypothetical protein